MIYAYQCTSCGFQLDVIKPLADFDRVESCVECGKIMQRAISPQKIYLSGTKVTDARFSTALGEVVRSDQDEKKKAKERGYIELGNENPHKHLKPNTKPYDY